MNPKISVVITTFNRAQKLERCLKDFINQNFDEPFEIVVVDDCSTDDTQKTVKRLRDKIEKKCQWPLNYIRLEKNFGNHTRPKNIGIKESKGEYITFQDDDNQPTPDKLRILWNAMKEYPKIDVVYGDRIIRDEERFEKKKTLIQKIAPFLSTVPKEFIGIRSEWDPVRLNFENFIDTSYVLAKKQALLDVGGWDEDLKKFADWNLWVRMAKDGKIFKRTPKVVQIYWMHKDMNQLKHESKLNAYGRHYPTFPPASCYIWPTNTLFGLWKKPKVAVITVSWNRLEYTKVFLDTMYKTTEYPFDHFWVDNGSTDGTRDFLKHKIAKENLILNAGNKGVPIAYNQALEKIRGKYDIVVFTDNDCEFIQAKWLEAMLDVYLRNKRFAMSPYVEGLRDNPGGAPRIDYTTIGEHTIGYAMHMGQICMFVPMKALEDWQFDANSFKHGAQSFQLKKVLQERGYVLAYLEDVKVKHSDTTGGQEKKYPQYQIDMKMAKAQRGSL